MEENKKEKIFVQGFYSLEDDGKFYIVDNMSNIMLLEPSFNSNYELCMVEVDSETPCTQCNLSLAWNLGSKRIELKSLCDVVNKNFTNIIQTFDRDKVLSEELHLEIISKLIEQFPVGSLIDSRIMNILDYYLSEEKLTKHNIIVQKYDI